jgi:hypothetical protein
MVGRGGTGASQRCVCTGAGSGGATEQVMACQPSPWLPHRLLPAVDDMPPFLMAALVAAARVGRNRPPPLLLRTSPVP